MRRHAFATIRTEGAVLPADLLYRLLEPKGDLPGLTPEDYHLAPGERLGEAINRSWARLIGTWAAFSAALQRLPASDQTATSLTRDRWLLPLFSELGYGRLTAAKALEIDGKSYPVSHGWNHTPIHLVGAKVSLDRRTAGLAGASRMSPHSLIQEVLNRSEDRLWGILANGLTLRVLRDNASLTRQAYVEFDLKAMFEGEVYSDFVLLWLICHQSRLEAEQPEECWLERWSRLAKEEGARALDTLRDGVQSAIEALGRGFLAWPGNQALQEALRSGALDIQEYYRELLRLGYRLIFLFVAEDRGLLLDPDAPAAARERYLKYYSTARLRHLAERHRGSRHVDLFRALKVIMAQLGKEGGAEALALPAMGSFLWSSDALRHLEECDLANADLLEAVRRLAFTTTGRVRRAVDFRNLGSEELGSVYESLLELHPELNRDAGVFELKTVSGSERKTTGSYYTPDSLVDCLLDSALEPVLAEALRQPDPERALLALKVCDPACGSGHFLVAAAHRLAKALAMVRSGDDEPSPDARRKALRDVVGHCLYGVDINPMAVELCKVSLWLEALEPGKPLSFLDHRILCGNSLLGATPALIVRGLPDDAFQPLEGDDRKVVSELRKENRTAAKAQLDLFGGDVTPGAGLASLGQGLSGLEALPDDDLASIRAKEARWAALLSSPDYQHARLLADAWCAAFVWRKTAEQRPAVTNRLLGIVEAHPESLSASLRAEIARLARQYSFFHWHLAFPDVFQVTADSLAAVQSGGGTSATGWTGGFDVVLGNPPWERVKLQEKEWFAARVPEIATAPNAAARGRLIAELERSDPSLYAAFREDLRQAEGESHLVRNSGAYPLCGRGDINTYSVFAELKRRIVRSTGRIGTIVPSGIATDDTTKFFFQDIMERQSLVSLFDFENRQGIFPGVHRSYKFCLLTLTGRARPAKGGAEFVFFAHKTEELRDPERRFSLSAADIALVNPNTRTCPLFRSRRDAELTKEVYKRIPVLVAEAGPSAEETNLWGIRFSTMFHMANDSGLFRTEQQLESDGWRLEGNVFVRGNQRYLPLYEAKMSQLWDHRAADVVRSLTAQQRQAQPRAIDEEEHKNPQRLAKPLYWVDEKECQVAGTEWDKHWLIGFTNVTSPTNERTCLPTALPWAAVGHSMPLILPSAPPRLCAFLLANLSSFVLDYLVRQKLGGVNLTFFIVRQLPVFPPNKALEPARWHVQASLEEWVSVRVAELVYTAWDMQPFAVDLGYSNVPPFRWDSERRFLIRCELDAAFFHLYGIERADVDYIMETFPIVKRKDEATFGEYRTKRLILERYDAMQRAMVSGVPYQSPLEPPAGDVAATR